MDCHQELHHNIITLTLLPANMHITSTHNALGIHFFALSSLFGCSLVRLQITFDHIINSRVNQDCITVLRAICKLFKSTLYYLQQYKTQIH